MSLTRLSPDNGTGLVSAPHDGGLKLVIMLAALAIIGSVIVLLAWWLAPSAPPPPVRSPFGVGPREAAPAANGLGAMIAAYQAGFYRELTATLKLLKESAAALPALLGLGFAYGVIHAAGPGHGKAVISAYILADDRSAIWRGFSLSLAAALVQAVVAIALVGIFTLMLKATARSMNEATRWVEIASFAAITLIGLAILWRKAGILIAAWRGDVSACAPGCTHDAALPAPRRRPFRETAGVVLAAGIRPCAGAIIVLVFAASQGIIWAGIAATLAMAMGTALTTGALALLAVGMKNVALALAGGRGNKAAIAIRVLECLAAACVAVLGAFLLFGYLTTGAAT